MSTIPATAVVAKAEQTDDQKWQAWVAKGKVHDRLVNHRLRLAAAVVVIGAVGVAVANALFR